MKPPLGTEREAAQQRLIDSAIEESRGRAGDLTGETGFLGIASRRSTDESDSSVAKRLREGTSAQAIAFQKLEAVMATTRGEVEELGKMSTAAAEGTDKLAVAAPPAAKGLDDVAGATKTASIPDSSFEGSLGEVQGSFRSRRGPAAEANPLGDITFGPGAAAVEAVVDGGPSPFATAIGDNLAQAITSGNFDNVGDALTASLKATFLSSFAENLSDIFAELATKALDALGSAFSGGEGGGFKLPFLHDGGVFQSGNRSGQGLAVLRDGERVLTPGQQRGGSAGTTVNLNLSADASRQTRREVMRYSRDIGSTIRQEEREYAV